MLTFLKETGSKLVLRPAAQVLVLCTLVLLSGPQLDGQDGEDIFRGTWQAVDPDKGLLILIAKRAGQASYFWGSTLDNAVYKGEWLPNGDNATFKWQDGTSHRLQREALGFSITSFDRNGMEIYAGRAQQVPQEVLGQWAKPPSEPEDLNSDRDAARGFFGVWEIQNENDPHYIIVEPDRSAASTWEGSNSSSSGLRGAWAKQGGELHIAWESGHYSIVRESERGFTYKRIEPGQVIEDDETEFSSASRTRKENLPLAWSSSYDETRQRQLGTVVFPSRKAARQFYRGDWLIQIKQGGFEKVNLGRFGGLSTSLDRSLSGQWLMSGQDIFMRWDDGIRKILSPIGRGFVIYEYKPGRPLDGVPSRVFAASPADPNKLQAYAEGRQEAVEQMMNLAESAGVDPNNTSSGWGNTFMRWVWPFSESDDYASTDAILTEAYVDEPGSEDPWWWPFWSEKRVLETESNLEEAGRPETSEENEPLVESEIELNPSAEVAVATSDLRPTDENVESNSAKQKTEAPARKKNDWYWPF
ncbi:MAG: hypothetical protein AAF546_01305 [Verrucomicrobiota bacterium]